MRRFFKAFLILIIIVSISVSCASVAVGCYLSSFKDSSIDPVLLKNSRSTAKTVFYHYDFYDRQAREVDGIAKEYEHIDSGIKYTFVPYSEIPQHLINAFVAIEDKRFFAHNGIDPIRSIHAVVNYVFGSKRSFGGSTITQQLVKNLTGRDEISVRRKINEAFAAINLEKEYSKTEILEKYLNVINLSNNCRGVGAAAEYYYSKSVSELTLSECATIAAITNNPSKYDPISHPENNRTRRNSVLSCMLDQNYLTIEEYKQTIEEPIALKPQSQLAPDRVNSWYTDMVIEDVIADMSEKYGISHHAASLMLYGGGYRIYTAMDAKIQDILEGYYSDISNFPADEKGNIPQSSMIVIDPYTGDVLAVAGGIGAKNGNRIQSYATDTKRPPGSIIKPLSVYAPAIENGIVKWSSIVSDTPVREINGRPWPANASNKYVGDVDLSYAVRYSLNTVAVRLLHDIGSDTSFDLLKNRLGMMSFDKSRDSTDSALALGQPSIGVTLREAVNSYTVFTNGIFCKSRSYFKVTDEEGNVILDNAADCNRVISSETSAVMTKLLQGVVTDGTAKGLISLSDSVEVAGKTGTTQGSCDRYFVGYTPQLLAGAWFGYEYPKPLSDFGGNYAAVFWDEVMSEIYAQLDYQVKRFKLPSNVVKRTYNVKTGEKAHPLDSTEYLADGWFVESKKHICN